MKLPAVTATFLGGALGAGAVGLGLVAAPIALPAGLVAGALVDLVRRSRSKAPPKAAAPASAAKAPPKAAAHPAAASHAVLAPPKTLAELRARAPALVVTHPAVGKTPAIRALNPAALQFVAANGALARKLELAEASKSAAAAVGLAKTMLSTDAELIYPGGQKTIDTMAPPLVLKTDPGDQGLEALNPAAAAFAMALKLPLGTVYPQAPTLVRWVHSGGHGWQEINPAAIDYVARTGKSFATVYPQPPPWSSSTDGSKDTAKHYAQLVGKPFDGPGGVYVNWYHPGSGVADFVGNVVSTAGHAVGDGIGAVDNAVGSVGDALGKIPFVGAPLAAIYDNAVMTPFRVADGLAHGKAVDQVVIDEFKKRLGDAREIAPYAQTVIAVVPGVGPVASGAISASLALAEGEPIQDVLVDAAAGAVPGGPFIKAAFHAGEAALQGKDPTDAVADMAQAAGVPIPDAAKQVLEAGVHATIAIAKGQKPQDAIVDAAIGAIPDPAVRASANAAKAVASGKNVADVLLQYGPTMVQGLPAGATQQLTNALGSGIALGNAQALQAVERSELLKNVAQLASNGAAGADQVVQAARAALPAPAQYGFDVGMGLVKHQVTRFQTETVRSALNKAQQAGYDAALALHVGRVTQPPPKGATPAAIAGHAISHGLAGAPRDRKKPVLQHLQGNPGLEHAAAAVTTAKASSARWAGVKHSLGTAAGALGGALVAGPVGAAAGVGLGVSAELGEWWRTHRPVSHGTPATTTEKKT